MPSVTPFKPVNVCLDLLSAPADFSLSHVARRFDRGDELKGDVAETDDANSATGNVANKTAAEEKASNKDIDCAMLSGCPFRSSR